VERENTELYREVQENVAVQGKADAKTAEIFAFFDEVRALLFLVCGIVGFWVGLG
jgi:hypothetical protein